MQMPERVQIEETEIANQGRYVLQPLEEGYGVTIGNAITSWLPFSYLQLSYDDLFSFWNWCVYVDREQAIHGDDAIRDSIRHPSNA